MYADIVTNAVDSTAVSVGNNGGKPFPYTIQAISVPQDQIMSTSLLDFTSIMLSFSIDI